MSSVFVVTVPSGLGGDPYLMRDYVRESLELGVLIVDEGVRWELLELPELGEVRAQGGPTVDASPAPPETADQAGGISFSGHGAREKKRIWQALRAYRDHNGLGSLGPLAELAGQGLTAAVLRGALLGDRLPMDTWRAIGRPWTGWELGPRVAKRFRDKKSGRPIGAA